MKGYEIELEDKGQDLTPISQQKIGDLCMIHHLPHIEYGYLKYKVLAIKEINY